MYRALTTTTLLSVSLFASTASAQYRTAPCTTGQCPTATNYTRPYGLLPALSRMTNSTVGLITGRPAYRANYAPAACANGQCNLHTRRFNTICGPNGCVPTTPYVNGNARYGQPLGNGHYVGDGHNHLRQLTPTVAPQYQPVNNYNLNNIATPARYRPANPFGSRYNTPYRVPAVRRGATTGSTLGVSADHGGELY